MIVIQIVLWILLWLAILFAVVLAAVVFMPVRYNVVAELGTKNIVALRASWLFYLFRFNLHYKNDKAHTQLKFLFFRIRLNKNKSKKEKKIRANAKQFIANEETIDEKKRKNPLKWLNDLYSLLTNNDTKIIIELCLTLSKRLYRNLWPRLFRLKGIVGFSDPCATGRFVGIYEALSNTIGLRDAIDLQGDFAGQNLAVNAHIIGKVTVRDMLGPVLWFCWQKPVRKRIKKLLFD